MSGATAKELRRDLRRAVGEEAVLLIDAHTKVIDHQILPNLNALTSQRQNHENRIRLLETRADALREHADLRLTRLEVLRDRSFLGRLRWLLTGR